MMVMGMLKKVMNKNQVRQLSSPLNSMGANMAAKPHIKKPTIPLSWASQLIPRLTGLLGVFAMTGCAMLVGYGNEISEAEAQAQVKGPDLFSNTGGLSTIVLVHRYFKRCCGASPSISIQGVSGNRVSNLGQFTAIDDFICWRVPRGEYSIVVKINQQAPVVYPVKLDNPRLVYLAVDSKLREPRPYGLSITPISKVLAEYHGQQTIARITQEHSNKHDEASLEALRTAKQKRAEKKLKCLLFETQPE